MKQSVKFALLSTAFGAALGLPASAGIVVWDCNIMLTPPEGFYPGVFINVVTQEYGWDDGDGGNVAGRMLALGYDPESSSPSPVSVGGYMSDYPPIVHGVGGGPANVAFGTMLGPTLDEPYHWGGGSGSTLPGETGTLGTSLTNYVGFRFRVYPSPGQWEIRYGWAEVSFLGGFGSAPTIVRMAYEDTGNGLAVGVAPAPGAIALLGAVGLVGGRRHRA